MINEAIIQSVLQQLHLCSGNVVMGLLNLNIKHNS